MFQVGVLPQLAVQVLHAEREMLAQSVDGRRGDVGRVGER